MANYANQVRIVTGNAKDIAHKEGVKEPWLQPTKWEPLKEAMRILKGNAFKLYMYLLSWDGAKMYDFSPASVLLVLASEHYTEDDYIRDYREYTEYAYEMLSKK